MSTPLPGASPVATPAEHKRWAAQVNAHRDVNMPAHLGLRAGSIRLRRVRGSGDSSGAGAGEDDRAPAYRVVSRSGEWGPSWILHRLYSAVSQRIRTMGRTGARRPPPVPVRCSDRGGLMLLHRIHARLFSDPEQREAAKLAAARVEALQLEQQLRRDDDGKQHGQAIGQQALQHDQAGPAIGSKRSASAAGLGRQEVPSQDRAG